MVEKIRKPRSPAARGVLHSVGDFAWEFMRTVWLVLGGLGKGLPVPACSTQGGCLGGRWKLLNPQAARQQRPVRIGLLRSLRNDPRPCDLR